MSAPASDKLPRLNVLSPHRDDAAFTVGRLMIAWADAGGPVRIINCFTKSDFISWREADWTPDLLTRLWLIAMAATPRPLREHTVGRLRRVVVSRFRRREDLRMIAHLGPTASLHDLGHRDAPRRYPCSLASIRRDEEWTEDRAEEARRLAEDLRGLVAGGVVVAPMSVGNHIDHRIVTEACASLHAGSILAFGEDSPYALEAADEIPARVESLSRRIGEPLEPITLAANGDGERHRAIVSAYASQTSPAQLAAIADRAARGETVWATRAFRALRPANP